jgi:hypothetical protein
MHGGAQRILRQSLGLREGLNAIHELYSQNLIGEDTDTPDFFGGRQVDNAIVYSKTIRCLCRIDSIRDGSAEFLKMFGINPHGHTPHVISPQVH